MVFANKQDLPNAMPVSELSDKLGLQSLRSRTVSFTLSLSIIELGDIDKIKYQKMFDEVPPSVL